MVDRDEADEVGQQPEDQPGAHETAPVFEFLALSMEMEALRNMLLVDNAAPGSAVDLNALSAKISRFGEVGGGKAVATLQSLVKDADPATELGAAILSAAQAALDKLPPFVRISQKFISASKEVIDSLEAKAAEFDASIQSPDLTGRPRSFQALQRISGTLEGMLQLMPETGTTLTKEVIKEIIDLALGDILAFSAERFKRFTGGEYESGTSEEIAFLWRKQMRSRACDISKG